MGLNPCDFTISIQARFWPVDPELVTPGRRCWWEIFWYGTWSWGKRSWEASLRDVSIILLTGRTSPSTSLPRGRAPMGDEHAEGDQRMTTRRILLLTAALNAATLAVALAAATVAQSQTHEFGLSAADSGHDV